jgi:hypothetical protein
MEKIHVMYSTSVFALILNQNNAEIQTYIFGDVGDAVHKCVAPQDLSGQEGGSNLGST